jgi:putative aldouronate transport system substrate-binding protein
MWGVPPQSLRDYGSTLDDLLIEGYTHIITGTQDIGYFDELIESWKKAGGDQVTAQVNEMYGK